MKKKAKPQIEVTCNYCGSKTETFVATPDNLLFCRHQVVGFPPTKDCMTDYYQEKKNVRKKEEERILAQKKIELRKKEKEKEVRAKHLKALEEYSHELNQKLRRQRYGI